MSIYLYPKIDNLDEQYTVSDWSIVMKVHELIEIIGDDHFYTGVPDSLLSGFCKYLMDKYGVSDRHIIGVDEGSCTAIAAGQYLSTGRIPVIYMQNSGIGNTVNPITSLTASEVYAIPCIYIVGWRGEPGVSDEPQHALQGKITPDILECIGLKTIRLNKDTDIDGFKKEYDEVSDCLKNGRSLAIIVSKGALEYNGEYSQSNDNEISREEAIEVILDNSEGELIVSTTGKTSRELYELREGRGEGHSTDFLTVGSMGYSSSIALGIALGTDRKVWCLDGDGAILMHMGAMSTIGSLGPSNFTHILLNNESHESVGGYPTTITSSNICNIAESFGYATVGSVRSIEALYEALKNIARIPGPHFIEVKVAIGSRKDLGRPTTTPEENKIDFMKNIKGEEQ